MARAIGGATAVDVSISAWFLIFSGYGALFIVSTKRLSEFKNRESHQVRSVMSSYTESFLTTLVSTALTISLLTYALWIFSVHEGNSWATVSILPLTVGFLRYTWHKEHGSGEAPERMIFSDASILLAGIFAVVSLTLAVYK
jgi:decaprenyl-phosphate phosphoribosyltransferase